MTEVPPQSGPLAGPQVIYRPGQYRNGGPSPWSVLSVHERQVLPLARVRAALASSIDGTEAKEAEHEAGAALLRGAGAEGPIRPAAVLVLLFEEDGDTRVVFTVRSSTLRAHSGEVSFPGGRLDEGETYEAAARREAFEEIGLDPTSLEVIGALTATPTLSSNTVMTPVVAIVPSRPVVAASPDEVELVFDVSLAELAQDEVFGEEWWFVEGRLNAEGAPRGEFPVWFFVVAGQTIWGATARTLVELLSRVFGVDVPPSIRSWRLT